MDGAMFGAIFVLVGAIFGALICIDDRLSRIADALERGRKDGDK